MRKAFKTGAPPPKLPPFTPDPVPVLLRKVVTDLPSTQRSPSRPGTHKESPKKDQLAPLFLFIFFDSGSSSSDVVTDRKKKIH